jgi:TPR repeat protein
MDSITFYQVAHLTDQEAIAQFIVRKKEFERVMSEIRSDNMKGSIQHYIFVGLRGSGKSTLLKRIEAEINTNEVLSSKLVVVNLSEEQAGIYRLHDLWERVCQELEVKRYDVDEVKWDDYGTDLTAYAKAAYLAVQKSLKKSNKKLVLLLDNIDRILENIKINDAHLFRELLTNYKDVRIIGGSTRLSEHHWKYDQPFYEFFNIIRLEALTIEEIKELLLFWGEFLDKPTLIEFVKKKTGRLNAVRILSDGMPRTMLNFLELLINQPDQQGYEYLRYIVDRATPVYQERLNNLTAFQQKAVLELSFFWDAAKIKELSQAAKIESKTLSASLNQLVELQIVEKIQGRGKNMMYRVKERFFNFWLVLTQGGPKQKSQAKGLTIFLETWYDVNELKSICSQFLGELTEGKIAADQAVLKAKALVHSRYLSVDERDKLLDNITAIIGENAKYKDILPHKAKEIYAHALELIKDNRLDDAQKEIESIEQDDSTKDLLLGNVYYLKGMKKPAEKLLIDAIKKGNIGALNILAILYKETGREKEAEKYYLLAIEKEDVNAISNLANLYIDTGRKEEAEKYYLLAIVKRDVDAINNLANLYADTGRTEEAERYYLLAIEKGVVEAMYNLAILYKETGRKEEAEKYYLLAIEKGVVEAMYNLANLYLNTGRKEEAEKYYLLSFEKGDVDAINNIASLYKDTGRKEEAEKYYLLAIEKRDTNAMFNLANLYTDTGRKEEAEKYYLLAIEQGVVDAILNLANLYKDTSRIKEAENYYLMAIEKGSTDALVNLSVLLYYQNRDKERAYSYIVEHNSKVNNDLNSLAIEIIVSVWSGRPEKLETATDLIKKLLESKDTELINLFIIDLLVHYQKNLVWQCFTVEPTCQNLKEIVRPLYYVTARFINNEDTKEELLALAPELKETVDQIYDAIIKRQEFYYGKERKRN